ncbi:RNA polymerase sigma factor [Ureibacillus chungkukjangi]|uniref:RNA polymerase sigma factor n=1 Tax=Ureibacillus chungkukjangi TaxID=1202712 RepID=UPI002559DFD1|nr:RNA polymerase sigma factor [Ureibacillus chungkukjangi]
MNNTRYYRRIKESCLVLKREPTWEQKIAEYVMENKENFYRLAYSYVQNQEDALDIVQDSIQKAILSKTLKDDKAIKSWFYKIIVNTSLDFLRKRKKLTVVDDTTLQLHSQGVSEYYEDIDLHRAINELSPDYRSVIVLRYFEDLKIEEVAEILELNISTIKTRIYKGLKLLRVQMEGLNLEEAKHNG